MSHVLREEPVGHGGAVRYLRPDHFVHQDRDHLRGSKQGSRQGTPDPLPGVTPASASAGSPTTTSLRAYLRMVPPDIVHHLQDVQPPLVALRQRLQDLVEPADTKWKFGSSAGARWLPQAKRTFRGR